MNIRRMNATDVDDLFDIWLRSVRATHNFLTEEDIQFYAPMVREYLSTLDAEIWVLCSESGGVCGFLGSAANKIDSLFIAPEFQRHGCGRQLVQFAQALHGELTVDVNEGNSAARRFYESCGFVTEGRSELDSTGRPFPLLHMRLPAPFRPGNSARPARAD